MRDHLLRDPIVCPSCGAEFEPEALLRTRRSRVVTSEREEPVKQAEVRAPEANAAEEEVEAVREEPAEEGEGEGEDDQAPDEDEVAEGEKEEEKEDLIEDASELGEDEADDELIEAIANERAGARGRGS